MPRKNCFSGCIVIFDKISDKVSDNTRHPLELCITKVLVYLFLLHILVPYISYIFLLLKDFPI